MGCDIIKVIDSNGNKSIYKQRLIVNSLVAETGINKEEAIKIASNITRAIKNLDKDEIFATEIREKVKYFLEKNHQQGLADDYDVISIGNNEIYKLINEGSSDNANLDKTPETIHKHVADNIFKQYALKNMPKDIREAYSECFIHIHDLEYLEPRGNNCNQNDIRYFIKNGVKLDGTGKHTSVANPARNITSLVNHLGQILNAGQSSMAGGQGVAYFNIFLSPFVKGLSYKEIKDAMQSYIYNSNMSYNSRGGQPVFSSMNVELGVPHFLKKEKAWGPGGQIVGTYGDYEEESDLILRAILEVIEEGDGNNKPHHFPNLIIALRDEFMETKKDLLYKCCEVVSKIPTPYFSNADLNGKSMSKALMGCRTSSWDNYKGDWDTDVMRCANLGFVTLNLPRLAYISKKEEGTTDKFYNLLDKYLNICKEALLYQRSLLERNLTQTNNLGFLTQENDDSGPYYHYENSSLSIGFNGLNECLLNLGYPPLDTEEGHNIGLEIINYINDYCLKQREKDGLRWACFATPAESTAGRFAKKDLEDFPDIKHAGTKKIPFYTNSSHCAVDSDINIIERIKYEAPFHKITLAGNILHLFLGEKPSTKAIYDLVKICKENEVMFWAFTNDYHYCFDCESRLNGLASKCNQCGSSNIENYSRITGYYQKIDLNGSGGWNKAKKEELKNRNRYEI